MFTSINLVPFKVGDIVTYEPFGGGHRAVRVTELDENKGIPAFSGTLVDPLTGDDIVPDEMGNSVWGYRYQVNAILKVAS